MMKTTIKNNMTLMIDDRSKKLTDDRYDAIDMMIDMNIWMFPKSGTPKSSILIGFSITNHPFWGTPIFGNTHI